MQPIAAAARSPTWPEAGEVVEAVVGEGASQIRDVRKGEAAGVLCELLHHLLYRAHPALPPVVVLRSEGQGGRGAGEERAGHGSAGAG